MVVTPAFLSSTESHYFPFLSYNLLSHLKLIFPIASANLSFSFGHKHFGLECICNLDLNLRGNELAVERKNHHY